MDTSGSLSSWKARAGTPDFTLCYCRTSFEPRPGEISAGQHLARKPDGKHRRQAVREPDPPRPPTLRNTATSTADSIRQLWRSLWEAVEHVAPPSLAGSSGAPDDARPEEHGHSYKQCER